MPQDRFTSVYDMHKEMLKDVGDAKEAIGMFGLSDAVIEKFGGELTKDDILTVARNSILGPEAARSPQEQDSTSTRDVIMDVVSFWMSTATVGSQGWLFHKNDAIRSFGRQMYLDINPDGCTQDQLDQARQEWGMETP